MSNAELQAWMEQKLEEDADALKKMDPPGQPSIEMKARTYVFEAAKLAHSTSVDLVNKKISCKDIASKLESVELEKKEVLDEHPEWVGRVMDMCEGEPCGPPLMVVAQIEAFQQLLGDIAAEVQNSTL